MPESYTGTEGNAALGFGLAVMDGNEDRRNGWRAINKTRDMIVTVRDAIVTWANATFLLKSDAAAAGVATGSKLVRYKSNTRVTVSSPIEAADAANKIYVDSAVGAIDLSGRVAKSGDTMTGDLTVPNLYVPASFPANSSWTVAYINGDGRVARGASSEAYKKFISLIDPSDLGNVHPDLYRYQMRSLQGSRGDGKWHYGWIAQRLAEDADLEPFVVYNAAGEPDSIDFIGLLIVQNAQQEQRIRALEERISAAEVDR